MKKRDRREWRKQYYEKNKKRERESNRIWEANHREQRNAYQRKRHREKYATDPEYRKKHLEHGRKSYAKRKEECKTYQKRPERLVKNNSYNILHRAVRSGSVKKPSSCESCGASNKTIQGHHKDHLEPLVVIWLCTTCHGLLHRRY